MTTFLPFVSGMSFSRIMNERDNGCIGGIVLDVLIEPSPRLGLPARRISSSPAILLLDVETAPTTVMSGDRRCGLAVSNARIVPSGPLMSALSIFDGTLDDNNRETYKSKIMQSFGMKRCFWCAQQLTFR